MPKSRPYIDDNGKTDAETYLEGCLDGTYVVGRHIKRLAKKMLKQIRNGHKRWHYSPDKAIRPVRFIEQFLRITDGAKAGQPLILEPYERCIIELAFGFVDDNGYRRFREVLMVIGRKNGKTALLAALNIYMLTSDGEVGAECYNGATTKEQAALCYGTTWDMLTKAAPAIKKRVDNKIIRKGMIEKRSCRGIRYDEKLNYLCTISSNSESLDGLNVHFAVLDELAASKDGGATYQVLKGSMGVRTQPMLVMISSNGHVRDGIFDDRRNYCLRWLKDEVEDDRFLGFLYELDSREEIDYPEMWPKANPGLGTVKSWDWMHDIVQQGKQNPRDWSEIVTKQFNIPENTYSSFLTYNECHNEATYEFDPKIDRYCCVGFDLSFSGDLSSCCAMWLRPGDEHIYEISHSWIAGEQIRRNGNSMRERDAVPYSLWEKEGWLTIIDGDKINQSVVIEWIQSLVNMGLYPRFCGYDNWHVDDWTERELERMFGKENFESVPAYAKVLSPAMLEHQVDLRAKRLVSNNNPLLEWCRSNVQTKPMDAMGNYFPNKKGLKPNKKIDAYMAELYAYVALKRHWDEYLQLIGWDKVLVTA